MRVCKSSNQSARGFTMVEIALSIAVVAFALVAILGVLPSGMSVQKENRDDTIITQEGRYWLEAIRSGAKGLEDITNYVESITITNLTSPGKTVTFDNTAATPLRPVDVIALLSTPKYMVAGSNVETNRVLARVKAITGPEAEKGPLTNEFSFRYELQVEITPSRSIPPQFVGSSSLDPSEQASLITYNETLGRNLQDVRLVLRWPVVQRGNGWFVGNDRKTFRARVAGKLELETNVTARVFATLNNSLGINPVVIEPNRFNVIRP